MNEHELAEALVGVAFLEGLPAEQFRSLAAIARHVELPLGDLIFREGDESGQVFLVISGRVSLEICAAGIGCRRILTVGEVELLGWSPLVGNSRLTATARTLAPTRLIAFDARQLLALCEAEPRLGYEFMKRIAAALAARLSATRMQMLDVYGAESPTLPR